HMGEPVDGFDTDGGAVRAVRTARRMLPADVVVLGTGVRPETRLAEAAGIAIGDTGGIVTDSRMETSVDGVWAAGDCVETVDLVTGRRGGGPPRAPATTPRGGGRINARG